MAFVGIMSGRIIWPPISRATIGSSWDSSRTARYSKSGCVCRFWPVYLSPTDTFQGAPSRSGVEIAAEMVRRVNGVLKQSFILVADPAFAKRSLICTCIWEGVTLISRVQKSAVHRPAHSRPGPSEKVWDASLPSLATLAKTGNGFHHYRLCLYGEQRLLRVK